MCKGTDESFFFNLDLHMEQNILTTEKVFKSHLDVKYLV